METPGLPAFYPLRGGFPHSEPGSTLSTDHIPASLEHTCWSARRTGRKWAGAKWVPGHSPPLIRRSPPWGGAQNHLFSPRNTQNKVGPNIWPLSDPVSSHCVMVHGKFWLPSGRCAGGGGGAGGSSRGRCSRPSGTQPLTRLRLQLASSGSSGASPPGACWHRSEVELVQLLFHHSVMSNPL